MEVRDDFLPIPLSSVPACFQSIPACLPRSLQGSNPREGSAGGHSCQCTSAQSPPYMSWAFTVSRHCCNLSRQDLMILISWAKAEGAHQQKEPIDQQNNPISAGAQTPWALLFPRALRPHTQQEPPLPPEQTQAGTPAPVQPPVQPSHGQGQGGDRRGLWSQPGTGRGQEGAVASVRACEITFRVSSQVFPS